MIDKEEFIQEAEAIQQHMLAHNVDPTLIEAHGNIFVSLGVNLVVFTLVQNGLIDKEYVPKLEKLIQHEIDEAHDLEE